MLTWEAASSDLIPVVKPLELKKNVWKRMSVQDRQAAGVERKCGNEHTYPVRR